MIPRAEFHPASTHSSSSSVVPHTPSKNALKHGLRSAAVLLPGDDAGEFQALRREFFRDYEPRTRDEADCVESIVGYKWRIAHCQRLQAAFRAALHGLVAGSPPGHLCEPDPHRWQHRTMDCGLEEQRLHKLMSKDRATLFELQRMRRNRLIDGAITVSASFLDFLGEEAPVEPPVEAVRDVSQDAVATGNTRAAETPARPSTDGQNGEYLKRTSPPGALRVPRVGDGAAHLPATAKSARPAVDSEASTVPPAMDPIEMNTNSRDFCRL